MSQWSRKTTLLIVCLLFAFEVTAATSEGDKSERQAQFMAVYLLHFSNFIEWPSEVVEGRTFFDICVLGNDKVSSLVKKLEGEIVKGQAIRVIFSPMAEQLKSCKIVYVGKKSIEQFLALEQVLKDSKILFVSDIKGFIEQSGTIEYFVENNRLCFAIDIESAKAKGLQVSSKLLRIAKIVR